MEGADESTELRRHPKDFLVRQMLDARSLDAKTKSNETQTFERRMRERERDKSRLGRKRTQNSSKAWRELSSVASAAVCPFVYLCVLFSVTRWIHYF